MKSLIDFIRYTKLISKAKFASKCQKGFIKMKYKWRACSYGKTVFLATILLFLWTIFSFYYFSNSRLKIEFFIGNYSLDLPFSGYKVDQRSHNLAVGEILPNCGIDAMCPNKHFPIHLKFGKSDSEMPEICVGGKYVIHKRLQNSVTSIHIVIVDPRQREAVSARGFDLTLDENLEILKQYLTEAVKEDDILIVIISDKASNKLDHDVRQQFVDLGSGMIQNLQSEFIWFMVSQKTINGFTPYESIIPYKENQSITMDFRQCIHIKIKGRPIVPDISGNLNYGREQFCLQANNTDLGEFCSDNQRLVPLEPGTLIHPKLIGNPIYGSPILVLAGNSLDSLSLVLETLINQPGINPDYVVISFNPTEILRVNELAILFNFTTIEVNETNYSNFLTISIKKMLRMFSSAVYFTVIEESVLLAPDFLQFLASTINLLQDSTILAVSAWNPNGFADFSHRPDLIYRIEDFSGAAFLIKVETFQKYFRPQMVNCCNKRGFEGWSLPHLSGKEFIVPDVSRCFVLPSVKTNQLSAPSLSRHRKTSLDPFNEVINAGRLHVSHYDNDLKNKLSSNATQLLQISKEEIDLCISQNDFSGILDKASRNDIALYVIAYQEKSENYDGMKLLFRCFGFVSSRLPFGLHRGIFRFTFDGGEIIILSNRNTLYLLPKYRQSVLILP